MNFQKIAVGILSTLVLGSSIHAANAEVKLAPIFTDNMVLQRDKPIPVWGRAKPGEKVSVILASATANAKPVRQQATVADAAGNWRVEMKPLTTKPLTTKPVAFGMTVKGDNELNVKNIAIGDVYICSGQSNMEWAVAQTNDAPAEIAAANFPNIRLLTVPKKVAGTPQKEFAGATSWQVCSPETIPGFSAVGYFFGRELNQKTNIPIGLINASWSGTIAQAWMSKSTLVKRDDLRDLTLQTEANLSASAVALEERLSAYWKANDVGTRQGWSTPALDDAAWKTIQVPGMWEAKGLPDFDGLVWFRQIVEIPANMAGKDLTLSLGTIDDMDTTFFNGEAIGSTNGWRLPRVYKVPGELVKAGRNIIAMRIHDSGGAGGFGSGQVPHLELANDTTQKVIFAPEWKYQVSAAFKDMQPIPADGSGDPNQPAVLYNGMIAPLLGFPVRGAIWYQGESNADQPKQYQTLFPELIKDWRTQWNAKQDGSEFGFYFVQLANFMGRTDQPIEAGWADLREAQIMALSTPRTGMATILDVGDALDIHPHNKQDVGKRLALAALAKEYGQKIEYSGPTFSKTEMVPNANRIRILLTHAKGLKTTDGKLPRGFAVQSIDGNWHSVEARIEGEAVVLATGAVVDPQGVRYAWANNPDVNLVNDAGLPAVPFRTDAP